MLEQRGLIQIKWLEYGNDIEKITYCLKHAGRFYELSGILRNGSGFRKKGRRFANGINRLRPGG